MSIPEAPQSSDRGGRKLDLLVIALWRSRGLERDGVEIKVSLSDWKRELSNGGKADWWWRHTNRFWIACPAALAPKIQPDLPPTWGLLACEPEKPVKVVVKAARREAEPLSWPVSVGLMRAAADCGIAALQRAESKGRAEGLKRGEELAEARGADGRYKAELERLQEKVRRFEKASGLDLTATNYHWTGIEDAGRIVRLIQKERLDPGWIGRQIAHYAQSTIDAAGRLAEEGRKAQRIAAIVSEALAKDEAAA